MPIINIKLPNGDMKRGEIISTASILQIKEEIIEALLPETKSTDYDLVHLANNDKDSYHNYTIKDNDTFLLITKKESQGNVFKLVDK